MSSTSPSKLRLATWKWIALITAVAGLLVVTLVMPIIAQKRTRATYWAAADAKSEGPELLDRISAPPGATGAAFRTFDRGPKTNTFADAGKAWMTWSQLQDSPQTISEVLVWYTPRFAAAGWRIHAPASATGAAFCNAPWLVEIKAAPRKPVAEAETKAESQGGPSRYELRLQWNNEFVAGSCQHP